MQSQISSIVKTEIEKFKQQEIAVAQNRLKAVLAAQMQEQMGRWRASVLQDETRRIRMEITNERTAWAKNLLDTWKKEYEQSIRKDAVDKSKAINAGKMTEQFALFMNGMEFNPKDAHFLGNPVDFVVFDGLDEGDLRRIIFVEVKTGKSQMNNRERMVREVVKAKAVDWVDLKFVMDEQKKETESLN